MAEMKKGPQRGPYERFFFLSYDSITCIRFVGYFLSVKAPLKEKAFPLSCYKSVPKTGRVLKPLYSKGKGREV